MAVSIPLVTAGIGAASSAMSLFGGKKNQAQMAPLGYQYANMAGADTNAYGQAGQIAQLGQQGQQLGQQAMNNPWKAYGQQGAFDASQLGQQQAGNAYNWGQAQSQLGASLVPYAQQIGQTAFDPQQSLYNRNFQQQQEQTRAGLAARGINMSPYGAGVEAQTNNNFNLDWANQQLQRQIQGGNAAGNLINTAGSNINYGQQMANTAPGLYQTASQYPYLTAQGQTNDSISGLNNSSQLTQQAFEDYLNYLKGGTSATGTAQNGVSINNAAQNQNFNQGQTLGKNFGASLNGLANNWPSSWGFTGGSPAGTGGYGGAPMTQLPAFY